MSDTTTTTTCDPNIELSPLIRIPEFIIFDALQKAINFIRADYKQALANGNDKKSMLYKLVGSLGIEKYKYFEQAIAIFITADTENPRELQIHMMFNMQRAGMPTIHITTPSETSGQNAIGVDEGEYQNWINLDEEEPAVAKTTNSIFTRRYKATYDAVITSDNSNEIILIYHILKALLASLTLHLAGNGLENVALSGQDLTPFVDVVPKSCFVRAVRISLEYETSTTSFEAQNILSEIIFTAKPIE